MKTNGRGAGVLVARGLRQSEHALDEAIAQTMRLGADMIDGRKAERLAASVGQQALKEVIVGLQAMATARDALIAAHVDLLSVATENQITWSLDGASETKPTGGGIVSLPLAANVA